MLCCFEICLSVYLKFLLWNMTYKILKDSKLVLFPIYMYVRIDFDSESLNIFCAILLNVIHHLICIHNALQQTPNV